MTDISLEPVVDGGTTVTVHQRRVPPELQTDQARAGLDGILQRLETVTSELAVGSRTAVVHRYMEGFRRSDHGAILDCLTDDVVWHIPGVRTTSGKAEFDDEIENPAFEGSPELTVERTIEAADIVVVTGTGVGRHRDAGQFRFAYNDLFTFRDNRICQVDSYVVPLTT